MTRSTHLVPVAGIAFAAFAAGCASTTTPESEIARRLEESEARVATLELDHGVALTSGWDGVAHRWDLSPVRAPRASLVDVAAPWGTLSDDRLRPPP